MNDCEFDEPAQTSVGLRMEINNRRLTNNKECVTTDILLSLPNYQYWKRIYMTIHNQHD